MYIRIGNICIHRSVPYLIAILPLFIDIRLYLTSLVCIILHETAHLLAAKLCGCGRTNIYVFPVGCRLHLEKSCTREELVYLSGPLASLLMWSVGLLLRDKMFSSVNMKIALLNMLPAVPLDGGMLVKSIILKNFGVYYGTKISRIFTVATAFFSALASVLHGNLWLSAISAVLVTSLKQKPVPFCVKRPYAGVKIFTVKENCPLLKISRFFSPYYYIIICIKSQEKLISENKITEYIKTHGITGNISDILLDKTV